MSLLTGTGSLVRLILHRDRFLLPLWVVGIALVPILYVSAIDEYFPTVAERQNYADLSMRNAGFVALYGPLSGASLGELVAWRAGFIPVVVGLIATLTVIRHTRGDEEAGRRELVEATVVGRNAGLAAALLVTSAASLTLGVLLALGAISQGLPAIGSWAFGLQIAAAGCVFAAVAAVAAQVSESAGIARAIAILTLGIAFALRLAGDVSSLHGGAVAWLSWLSPIGWVHRIRPYGGEDWRPAALALGVALILAAGSFWLSARRDLGAGLIPPRLGPGTAAPGLRSPLALAWRIHRGLLAAWVAGFASLGIVLGGIAEGVGDMLRDNPDFTDAVARVGGPGSAIDSFLAGILSLFGLIASGYAIQATLKLREEEMSGRAEPILSTAVGRLRWAGSHLTFALLGPAVALAAFGLTAGLAHGMNAGDVGSELPRVLAGALAQVPAMWMLAAVTALLFGLLPQVATLSWGSLALCLAIMLVGAVVRLNRWIVDLSPFSHIPHLPGREAEALPLLALTAVAAALVAIGLASLLRRDIPSA